ncbi:MAG: hypothetical protein IIA91_08705 [Chloroflexi bacterium]|nr:hypothetical protein [Chloroflexota bacterium]
MRKRSPGIAFWWIAAAVAAAAVVIGCGISSSELNLDTFLTPTPSGPSATASIDVTLTGSDTETCELVFAVGTANNGTVGDITDEPCVPGNPNTDSATITFTSQPDVCGPGKGTFTYTTNDGSATSAPATVTVDIPCIEVGTEER